MGLIEDRVTGTGENWARRWGDRLKSWLSGIVGWGIEIFADAISKAASPKLKPLIDTIEATGKVPPELQPFLDEMKSPTGETGAIFASSASNALIGGAVGKLLDAVLLPAAYALNSVTQNVILTEGQYITLWLRGFIDDATLTKYMSWLGHDMSDEAGLRELSQVRLDPQAVMRLWLRDKDKWSNFWQDLKDSGVSQDRIEVFQELAYSMPTPQDIVMWMGREAFEKDAIEKYGLDDEYDRLDLTWFDKAGVKPDVIKYYWRAHWQHASFGQVTEMLHRGLLTEADVWEWFRVVEIPPYWRQKLIDMSWNVPTRVDVRRWYDMRTISEEELREVYGRQGYHDKDLDNYVLWTKVYVAFPDLIARFKNGWITEDDVRSELTALGMPEDRVTEMIQTKIKPDAAERTSDERDLTKTDIYRGVKKEILTRSQGYTLLQGMGYDEAEAKFILDLNAPVDKEEAVVKERELSKADVLKAFKQGDIDEPETISRLMGIRYTAADAQFLANLVSDAKEPIEDEKQRELTKVDIIKGVKAGVITAEEGYIMLLDIGYTPTDAQFILDVRVEAEVGSPDTYGEFKQIVGSYRASRSLETKEVSPELIQAERDLKAAEAALANAKTRKTKPIRLAELEETAEAAKQLYHQLLTATE